MTKLSFILVFALVPLFAQTNTVAGAGYSFPVPLNVAPGQVITLFVDGIGASLTQTVRAPAGPLPLTLAGISVTLKQSSSNTPVPLLSVQPFSTLTAVTVQIPFELPTLCPLCERPSFPAPQLLVAENGRTGAAIDLTPLADQLHILTSCDPLFPNAVQRINLTGLPCAPMITHADGSLVSAAKPAKAGEELVAYAVGLGLTNPFVETGKPAAAPAATVQAFTIDYNYRPNALATKPLTFPNTGDPAPQMAPAYNGLTTTFVGLYQINFVVVGAPAGIPACVDTTTIPPGTNAVESNLTVSFGGAFSFDGAGICVVPGS